MVEKPPGSAIPDEVRDAFDQAVSQLIQWNDGSEPTISVKGDAETISKVVTLAEPFKDTMPASVYWRMAAYANSSFERRASAVQLSKDSSYSTGAWCLREWIEDKKVRFDIVSAAPEGEIAKQQASVRQPLEALQEDRSEPAESDVPRKRRRRSRSGG